MEQTAQPRKVIKPPKISATKRRPLSYTCAAPTDAVLVLLQVSPGAKFEPFNSLSKKSTHSICFVSWVEFSKDRGCGSQGRIISHIA